MEILGGLALLVDKFVPLALTISVGIMFNAAAFHGLHDPGGIAGALVGLVLVYAYEDRFSSLLSV